MLGLCEIIRNRISIYVGAGLAEIMGISRCQHQCVTTQGMAGLRIMLQTWRRKAEFSWDLLNTFKPRVYLNSPLQKPQKSSQFKNFASNTLIENFVTVVMENLNKITMNKLLYYEMQWFICSKESSDRKPERDDSHPGTG